MIMENMNHTIICICGPTAVGKTHFAIEAALAVGGEIVSCDSMQLYKYMDIGSANPTPEERRRVKHYLVDEIDPGEDFSVAKYQELDQAAIAEILQKGKMPVIAGGTGLYLDSIIYDMDFSAPPRDDGFRRKMYDLAEEKGPEAVYGLLQEKDPDAASRIHPNNLKKVIRALEAAESGNPVRNFATDLRPRKEYNPVLIGLTRDRAELYGRIDRRVDVLLEQGLEDEVRGLLQRGLDENDISMKGIGYKELIGFLHGEYPREEAVRLIKRNTRHLAKRQMTWLRRYHDMKWFDISSYLDEESCIREMNLWIRDRIRK